MAFLDAGIGQLYNAYNTHWQAYNRLKNNDPSSNLLLFYAVECGLKAVWLRRYNLNKISRMPEDKRKFGHNLNLWLKELRISKNYIIIGTFRLERNNEVFNIADAHQAWRYGVRIHPVDEEKLVSSLNKLIDWIRRNY